MGIETETRSSPIYEELCKNIGQEKVSDDETILVTYGYDISPTPFRKPSMVVFPKTKEDVSEVCKLANQYKIPVTAMSAGVTMSGLSIPEDGGIVLDFRSMNKIWDINTDSGYAVIEPGVTFDQFTSALRKKGFRCHIPTSPSTTTPLSNYLMASSGSLVNRHLDSIVSLQVVLADGTIVDTGMDAWKSSTPFKRYSPLPDLTGIFCCSYGTLGVVTKGSVRIYPINEANRVHLAAFNDYGSSVKYVKDVIDNNLCEHSIIWSWPTCVTYDMTVSRDGEVDIPPDLMNDPRKAPEALPYNIVTTFMSGYEEMMKVADSICAKVAEKYGGRAISEEEMKEKLPGALEAWTTFYGEYHHPGMYHVKKYGLGKYVPWIVHSEPGKSAEIEKMAMSKMWEIGLKPICYYAQPYDFGRAMFFRAYSYADPKDPEQAKRVGAAYKEMYDTVMENYGAVPNRCRAADHGENSYLLKMGGYGELLRSIKKMVDPNNILNPNVVF
ncbi:FAD-binding oxidoreductase [Chloroflexota bacterium]